MSVCVCASIYCIYVCVCPCIVCLCEFYRPSRRCLQSRLPSMGKRTKD